MAAQAPRLSGCILERLGRNALRSMKRERRHRRRYRLEDNSNTWLTATDLVFIDPVGTGYSRAVAGEKPEQFYGVEEDIHSVAEFIRTLCHAEPALAVAEISCRRKLWNDSRRRTCRSIFWSTRESA